MNEGQTDQFGIVISVVGILQFSQRLLQFGCESGPGVSCLRFGNIHGDSVFNTFEDKFNTGTLNVQQRLIDIVV